MAKTRPADMSLASRYALFVNLDYVSVGDVRTFTYALLLEQDRGAAKLRGFLTDPALPTFDLIVPVFEHDLVRIPPPSWIPVPDDGVMRSAFLRGPGWRDDIVLSAQISNFGIQTVAFPDDAPIELVWDTLVREVAAGWEAPRMPIKYFEDAERVRRRLGVEARSSKARGPDHA